MTLYDAESGNLTLVASGDTMITRRLSVFKEPGFLSLIDLFKSADVGYTNLEMLMHEFEHSPGMAGGTFTGSDPANLKELSWAGINLVSTANNHSYDFGEGGVLTNIGHLKETGLAFAGTGRNQSEARAPGYLDTSEGRVALISASSTFSEAGRAMDQRPDLPGRPGLNALRHSATYTVDRPAFDSMRRISRSLGFEASNAAQRRFRPKGTVMEDNDTQLGFLGKKFVLGEDFGKTTRPNQRDMDENLKWVKDASRMADWVFVSFHCHESGDTTDEPPEFLQTFARACIDAGADAFLGHGPHITRAVEIYENKPIFYSLGNFIFQNDTVRWQPAFNYESVGLGPGEHAGRLLRPAQRKRHTRISRRHGLLEQCCRPMRIPGGGPAQDRTSSDRLGTREGEVAEGQTRARNRSVEPTLTGEDQTALRGSRCGGQGTGWYRSHRTLITTS